MRFKPLLLSLLSFSALAELDHVQPSSWWIGMQHKDVQIMLHGNDIGDDKVRVSYPGVALIDVQHSDNNNYLFVTLRISDDAEPGKVGITLDSDTAWVDLLEREPGSAQRQGFNNSDVIYLITPDRFANGDSTNDEVADLKEGKNREHVGGRHGGDIQGIIDHLDYLDDMGYTQLWLMPVLENDQASYSYHGYSTTDYYRIDPRYGSNGLYRQLSDQLAKRNMGLIKDVILNHIGSEHWWMKDMPASDWINHGGKFVGTNHRRETMHDPHAAPGEAAGFKDGWFVPSMPDLNQRNPLLATYLIQNSIWWIETAKLSGIRLDTYSYPDSAFLSEYTRRVMQEYPNFSMVGEEWSTNPAIVSYWQRGTKRHDGYQSALSSLMDFPLQDAVVKGLTAPETWSSGISSIYQTLANDFVYGNASDLVVFPDNHDMSRIFSQLNEDIALTKMALAFYATTRGTPQYFYGTEILMKNPGTDDHGVIRSDFPGGWPDDKVNGFNGKGLTAEQAEMQAWLRQLLNWRKTSAAVTSGKLVHYIPYDGTYVYFRVADKQRVMVVLNKGQARTIPMSYFHAMLGDAKQGKDVMLGSDVALSGDLALDAKSVRIIEF